MWFHYTHKVIYYQINFREAAGKSLHSVQTLENTQENKICIQIFQLDVSVWSPVKKQGKLVNLFFYKTEVIIMKNCCCHLSIFICWNLNYCLPIQSQSNSLFNKIYLQQNDFFRYHFSEYAQEFVRSKHFYQKLSFNYKKLMKHCFDETSKDIDTFKLLKRKTLSKNVLKSYNVFFCKYLISSRNLQNRLFSYWKVESCLAIFLNWKWKREREREQWNWIKKSVFQ